MKDFKTFFKSNKLKDYFDKYHCDYFLILNTNEWLEETPRLNENAVYFISNFTGDTSSILLSKNGDCFIFVDGRYHIQAEKEVKVGIEIIKLQQNQKEIDEIINKIKENSIIGVYSKTISLAKYRTLNRLLLSKNIRIKVLDKDIIQYNKNNNGSKKTFTTSGCEPKKMNTNIPMLITDIKDASYITKKRCFNKIGNSSFYEKIFISKDNKITTFKNSNELKYFLKNYNGKIGINAKKINMYDFNLISKPVIVNDRLSLLQSIKTNAEIDKLKIAFKIVDKSLLQIRDFIDNCKDSIISEFDIYTKLIKLFYKNGASGLSFQPIVAINKNSALAHYGNPSKEIFLKDGDLILIDCGIFCKEGLATDTTRVFVKGEANDLQKKVYTLVIKAFLQCYIQNKTGYELNKTAHNILDNKISGFVFNHGLGHGIGISVHQSPPCLNSSNIAKKTFKNNMCFTIEPGLYNKNCFGVRLENSFYFKNCKKISLTTIGFEEKMIVLDVLSNEEKNVLLKYFNLIS